MLPIPVRLWSNTAMTSTLENKEQSNGLKAREVAVRTFMAVTLKKRPFDVALDDIATEAGLGSRDRAFVMNLLMISLRRFGSLRSLLTTLMKSDLPRNATWTEAALITGLTQILLMRTADHAAVNETVTLIKNLPGKEKGFAGLVNAVLRRATREQGKLLKKLNSRPEKDLPAWIFNSWADSYSKETAIKIATSLQYTPPLDISLKPDQNPEEWAEKLEAKILPTGSLRRAIGDVTILPGYETGEWWIQDMAAAIPATLLGDISGKHILDLCAAPGGKTMQLAARGAKVTSVDRSKNRLKRLKANLERTELKADIFTDDASKFKPNTPVDHILLDAPCSATGTLRRNPDVTWTKAPEDVEKLAALQTRIFEHAFNLLPVGGTLVYCVCSLEEIEGKGQVELFLKHTPNAKRVPIKASELGGIEQIITEEGDLLCLPSSMAREGGMDGFFASRITKTK